MFKLAAILAIAFLAINNCNGRPVQGREFVVDLWWPFYGENNFMLKDHLVSSYKAIEEATENLPSTDKYKRLVGRQSWGSSFWSTMLTLLSCVPSQAWPHSRVALGPDPNQPHIYAYAHGSENGTRNEDGEFWREMIIVDRSKVGIELDPPTAENPWWPLAFAEAAFKVETDYQTGWEPVADEDYSNDDPVKLLEFFTGEKAFTHPGLVNDDKTWKLFEASDKRPTMILLDDKGWFALRGVKGGDIREFKMSRFPSDGDELSVTRNFDDLLKVGPLWKLVTLGEDFHEWDNTTETTWDADS